MSLCKFFYCLVCIIIFINVCNGIEIDDANVLISLGQPYYSGVVLPSPQNWAYSDDSVLLLDGSNDIKNYKLSLDKNAKSSELIEHLINKRLDGYLKLFPKNKWNLAADNISVTFLLIDNPEAKNHIEKLKIKKEDVKEQGYVLDIDKQAVICIGADNQGLAFGAASFIQLIHADKGKVVVRKAKIIDYPIFINRCVSEAYLPGAEIFDWMTIYKFNQFGTHYNFLNWNDKLIEDNQKAKALLAASQYIEKYGTVSLRVEIHVGGRSNIKRIDISDDNDVNQLLSLVTTLIDKYAVATIAILADDIGEKNTLTANEAKMFKSWGQAHSYLVNKVYKKIQDVKPGTRLLFCPPYYRGKASVWFNPKHPKYDAEVEKTALQYMKDIQSINENVGIIWTGPATESLKIEQEDINHYLNLLNNKFKLSYWDNTWHYHQPMRNFHADYMEGFENYCHDRGCYLYINGNLPIGKFFAATASDYYWNPKQFDSRRSTRQAVIQFMGIEAIEIVEEFYEFRGDNYFAQFAQNADIEKFEKIVNEIGRVSLDQGINNYCKKTYEQVKNSRN